MSAKMNTNLYFISLTKLRKWADFRLPPAVNDPSAYITESDTTEEHLRKDCMGLPHLLKMNFHFPMEG